MGKVKPIQAFVLVECRAKLLEVFWAFDPGGRLADFCKVGRNKPTRIAMIPITTSSSMSVKAMRRAMRGD
jgi:hypothetical protein